MWFALICTLAFNLPLKQNEVYKYKGKNIFLSKKVIVFFCFFCYIKVRVKIVTLQQNQCCAPLLVSTVCFSKSPCHFVISVTCPIFPVNMLKVIF